MDIDAINTVFRDEPPDEMSVQSFDHRGHRLVLLFAFNGGPREDDDYVVEFDQVIIFHLPSILHATAVFRRADEPERERLVPPVSYDAAEVSGLPGAYTVVALDDADGNPLGYYVAAASVTASWRRRQ